jgi:hypothetical protein
MELQRIVADLRRERQRIDRAILALEGAGRRDGKAQGIAGVSTRLLSPRRRRLSAEARKRISDGMKRRWIARRRGTNRKSIAKAT